MADMRFTPAQQDAIFAGRGNLLVSAAAGSGKTAVLTQRVIEMLTGKDPVPADRLVVVTFTVAAAAELRQRIEEKLSALIEEDPENSLLQSQYTLLGKARISTIHALCNELIRDHFDKLELPLHYRLVDSNELSVLEQEVLEEYLNDCYDAEDHTFMELAEFFVGSDDRRLFQMIAGVYEWIRSSPFPFYLLDRSLEEYEKEVPFAESIWAEPIVSYVTNALKTAQKYLQKALSLCYSTEQTMQKYAPAIEQDQDTVTFLLRTLAEKDWNRACGIMEHREKKRVSPIRNFEDKDLLEEIKALRKEGNDLLDGLVEKYFLTEEEFAEDRKLLSRYIGLLFQRVKEFTQRMDREKKEREILDFNDLEHFALQLLIDREGDLCRKTQVAQNLQFEEILVDECQDINETQNLIFWALSEGEDTARIRSEDLLTGSRNLFMVGDVKQSVYRFRNAMPALFVQRKELFPRYDREKETFPAKILLQENFRSRKEVTGTVNEIFRRVMTSELGDVDYTTEEYLIPSATYQDYSRAKSELYLLETTEETGGKKKNSVKERLEREAEFIAEMIDKMIASGYLVEEKGKMRPCTYRDFCILLRSKKGKTDVFAQKLQDSGVPCYADSSNGYFDAFEVAIMLHLLRVIDNPLLEVSLFSVLISPMFGFTPDEIAKIRLRNKKLSLYITLQQAAAEGDVKCQRFVDTLTSLREQAAILSTDRLIQRIYDRTDFLFVVESMTSGDQRKANLHLLLNYAKEYEAIGYQGLEGFLRFVDKASERGEDFTSANTVSQKADVVRIMSIHGSKGLEFPICIVADLGKSFYTQDLNQGYLFHEQYGFGMNIRKPTERKEYSNLPLEAIRLVSRQEVWSEEMRILYVALTRAKEKLILVASGTHLKEKLARQRTRTAVEPFSLRQRKDYLSWILAAIGQENGVEGFLQEKVNKLSLPWMDCFYRDLREEVPLEERVITLEAEPDEEILKKLEASLQFSYPYEVLSALPAKITATALAKQEQGEETQLPPLTLDEDGGMTGAHRGTVLHSFMQYADYRKAKENLGREITRLVEEGFLTAQDAKLLNRRKIEAFLRSPLLRRMEEAKALYREYAFIYEVPSGQVDSTLPEDFQQETIMLQGIADAVIEEEDGIVIVDYKTDRVDREEELIQRYCNQLAIYRRALGKYFEKPVKKCFLYSLYLEKAIEV